jgi:hypothetical protein
VNDHDEDDGREKECVRRKRKEMMESGVVDAGARPSLLALAPWSVQAALSLSRRSGKRGDWQRRRSRCSGKNGYVRFPWYLHPGADAVLHPATHSTAQWAHARKEKRAVVGKLTFHAIMDGSAECGHCREAEPRQGAKRRRPPVGNLAASGAWCMSFGF